MRGNSLNIMQLNKELKYFLGNGRIVLRPKFER
jgi:hypothetical protein